MNLTETLQKLNELDLADFDFENIGEWPAAAKAIACTLIFLLTLILGYQFHLTSLHSQYQQIAAVENQLKESFRIKSFQSANLATYRQQMLDMEVAFAALLRQLPGDTEVPGLLEDISFAGRGAGLQFEGIKLQSEKITEYYIELPISISVKGNYHDLGNFVSSVANLSRIVTLHDLKIEQDRGQLKMDILAKTYRYNDKGR
ncbi:hypothetical protein CI610_01212 [invertebrate metagenome]|uniref:Pilus assembly protein PilP n=1 Tax=invertebrate metagenome TaxID=1711999 RepID=A0A2H9T9D9_9ZZZZ